MILQEYKHSLHKLCWFFLKGMAIKCVRPNNATHQHRKLNLCFFFIYTVCQTLKSPQYMTIENDFNRVFYQFQSKNKQYVQALRKTITD